MKKNENTTLVKFKNDQPVIALPKPDVFQNDLLSRKAKTARVSFSEAPVPWLYAFIFLSWGLCILWFQPRLMLLLDMAYNVPSWLALVFFILFIDFAWLYGLFNIGVVVFALAYKYIPGLKKTFNIKELELTTVQPPVAILYTTCNDFVEESVESCVRQDYPDFTVYILDDSSNPDYMRRVDRFAERFPGKVKVVRRPDRKAFKAGNMNHGLSEAAIHEPYFAIADADEILPADFLSKLVPLMESDPKLGFVQANHRANPRSSSPLAKSQGIGIDIHWEWYQPLRNRFGFVMFLGHGALLRRKCWEEVGGFPDIVSEDLGFAIAIREAGYRGFFAEHVICFEDFPDSVRSFRIRHMKWTRGTCEFLAKKTRWLLRARNITWTEKFDILFPTMNLPLTLLYFSFMVNANLLLPYFFGNTQIMTIENGSFGFTIPVLTLDKGFEMIYSADFFIITMLTFFAPVLCFMLALWRKPIKLFRFLSHSTSLYAALSPLSSIGVLAYMISGKAFFLVTGDQKQAEHKTGVSVGKLRTRLKDGWSSFLKKSHPDHWIVQGFELFIGILFGIMCIYMFQISFFGLCFAFILLPLMHHLKWENRLVRLMVYMPLTLILFGISLATLNLIGIQAAFFGYGFHF